MLLQHVEHAAAVDGAAAAAALLVVGTGAPALANADMLPPRTSSPASASAPPATTTTTTTPPKKAGSGSGQTHSRNASDGSGSHAAASPPHVKSASVLGSEKIVPHTHHPATLLHELQPRPHSPSPLQQEQQLLEGRIRSVSFNGADAERSATRASQNSVELSREGSHRMSEGMLADVFPHTPHTTHEQHAMRPHGGSADLSLNERLAAAAGGSPHSSSGSAGGGPSMMVQSPGGTLSSASPRSESQTALLRAHSLCTALYIGCAVVDAPNSSVEVNRHIEKMHETAATNASVPVVLGLPRLRGGNVQVLDAREHSRLVASFPIRNIRFVARGTNVPTCIGITSDLSSALDLLSPDYFVEVVPGTRHSSLSSGTRSVVAAAAAAARQAARELSSPGSSLAREREREEHNTSRGSLNSGRARSGSLSGAGNASAFHSSTNANVTCTGTGTPTSVDGAGAPASRAHEATETIFLDEPASGANASSRKDSSTSSTTAASASSTTAAAAPPPPAAAAVAEAVALAASVVAVAAAADVPPSVIVAAAGPHHLPVGDVVPALAAMTPLDDANGSSIMAEVPTEDVSPATPSTGMHPAAVPTASAPTLELAATTQSSAATSAATLDNGLSAPIAVPPPTIVTTLLSSADVTTSTPARPRSTLTAATPASRRGSGPPPAFRCHIFKFATEADAENALAGVAQAFGVQGNMEPLADPLLYGIDVSIGLIEEDAKKTQTVCPLAKDVFRMRLQHERRIVITVTQTSPQQMIIENISTLHIGEVSGPNSDLAADTKFLKTAELINSDTPQGKTVSATFKWPAIQGCTVETQRDESITLNLTVDVELVGLTEPVRLHRQFKVRVLKSTERFWYQGKRDSVPVSYDVRLHASRDAEGQTVYSLKTVAMRTVQPKDTYIGRLNKMFNYIRTDSKQEAGPTASGGVPGLTRSNSLTPQSPGSTTLQLDPLNASTMSSAGPDASANASVAAKDSDAESENEEQIVLSGSGKVERDVKAAALDVWADALRKWDTSPPRNIVSLCHRGVPDALRHMVWLRLVGDYDKELADSYPFLLIKPSATEHVIRSDLMRTFPAHDFFKDADGDGQRRLFNVNKAYSVYDEEIGYCQGLSFVSAVLLLHMPEEEAFIVFTKVMMNYGVREMFKPGFEALQLKFYQLERLIEEQLPDVYTHFKEQRVEVHMFASQWFLTLFAAKFALPVAYRIMDLVLCEGAIVLFYIAMGLLRLARKDIIRLEFEELLHYFRLTLPRTFVTDEQATDLIRAAYSTKIVEKKLQKYEQDYYAQKAAQLAKQNEEPEEDPLVRLQRENAELTAANQRLERETDGMAHELVSSKVSLQAAINSLQDANMHLRVEVDQLKETLAKTVQEAEEDRGRLEEEARQVKAMYRKALEENDAQTRSLQTQLDQLKEEHSTVVASASKNQQDYETLVKKMDAHQALSSTDANMLQLQQTVHDTELALAQTKLLLVDAECKNQLLEQQLLAAQQALQEANKKPNPLGWLKKRT
eukprot:m.178543 g.178543  ORF g.178543 m.178543 type:complete len:1507 (+) comp17396_c0_seq1:283-4803(+)